MSVIGFKIGSVTEQYNYPALDNKPVIDAVPTEGSTNAVQSGGVYDAIPTIDPTLSQSGQAADAKETGEVRNDLSNITGCERLPITAEKKYINLGGTSVTMSDGTPQITGNSSSWDLTLVPCAAGDIFTINGTGGASTRLWGFVSSEGTILAKAKASVTETELLLTAPESSAWLIIHDNSNSVSYKGELTKKSIQRLDNLTEKAESVAVTDGISGKYAGVTFSNSDGKLKMSGTCSTGRRILFLGGQFGSKILSSAFEKTLDAGTYVFETDLTGYSSDLNYSIRATYTTFNDEFYVINSGEGKKTIVTFTAPVMIGFMVPENRNFGTEENPTYLSCIVKKFTAIDYVARQDVGSIEDILDRVIKVNNYDLQLKMRCKIGNITYNDTNPSSPIEGYNRKRLITKQYVDVSSLKGRFVKVQLPSDFKFIFHEYNKDADGNYIYDNPLTAKHSRVWQNTDSYVPVNADYLRFVIAKQDETQDIEDSETNLTITIIVDQLEPLLSVSHGNFCRSQYDGYGYSVEHNYIIAKSTRNISNLIEIPKHNDYNDYVYDPFKYVIVKTTLGSESDHSIIFLDDAFEVTSSFTTSDRSTLTDKSAKYLLVTVTSTDTIVYVGFNNTSNIETFTYNSYKPELNANCIPTLADSIHNSDGAKTNEFRTVLQYLFNPEFGYGNHYTAYHAVCEKVESDGTESDPTRQMYEGEKFQIDCSSFLKLVLEGITPKNSRYYTDQNYKARHAHTFNNKAEYDTEFGRMTANKLAKYAYDNGWLFEINTDMSNLEVGDVVFLGGMSDRYNFFKNIGHAAFVANVYDRNDGRYRIRVIEAGSNFDHAVTFGNYEKSNDPTYDMPNLIYAARFPMPYSSIDTSNMVEGFTGINEHITLTNGSYKDYTFSLNKPINIAEPYTVVIRGKLPDNVYLRVYCCNKEITIGQYGDVMRYSNDGVYVFQGYVPINVDTTGIDTTSFDLRLVAYSSVNDDCQIDKVEMFNAIYNPVY